MRIGLSVETTKLRLHLVNTFVTRIDARYFASVKVPFDAKAMISGCHVYMTVGVELTCPRKDLILLILLPLP